MTDFRIGHGYDAHRLTEGRELILGGVKIESPVGLLGHSDADVLVHALIDSILGAAALGDIGRLYPDTDPAYEGASSILLLRNAGMLLRESGYEISNIDSTLVLQAPKIAPYVEQMRKNVAEALGLTLSRVSVKATTEEKMGFTGSGIGACAHAVALIFKP